MRSAANAATAVAAAAAAHQQQQHVEIRQQVSCGLTIRMSAGITAQQQLCSGLAAAAHSRPPAG